MRNNHKRFFIANLPPDINENEVKKQFASYGIVTSVEIKHRKEGRNENISPVFAFMNIEIDDQTLNKCFREFSDFDWNGYQVNLQLAKENFLDRLKRERAEEKSKPKKNEDADIEIVRNNYIPPVDQTLYKHTDYTSTESSNSESEDEIKPELIKKQVEKPMNNLDYVVKNNKFNFTNGKSIKIDNISNAPVHIMNSKEKNVMVKDKKAQEADEKRKKSLIMMKNSYVQQKSIIKTALSNVDTKKNNKIIFNEEISASDKSVKRKLNHEKFNYNVYKNKKQKVSLFDDENEEEASINFEIKKQFEGEKGQKLLQLQSRFKNDIRFTLDSRFMDNDDGQEMVYEDSEEDEKKKQLDILESVLGHKVVNQKSKDVEEKERTKPRKTMLRYDPSKLEHSRFEIKDHDRNEASKTMKENKKNEENVEDKPKVDVSKDTFYKVTNDLKDSLQNKQIFSLSSMFGYTEKDETEQEEPREIIKTKSFFMDQNPFKYDSSDSEDEESTKITQKEQTTENKKLKNTVQKTFKKETFFFQDNDERLKEAHEFLDKLNNQESDKPFNEKRRELKKIVRDKIKNNQRNHRPFRKKLGRHKMIKVKKAKKK